MLTGCGSLGFLEEGCSLFQGNINLDAQMQWTGLLEAKIDLFLKNRMPGV